MGLITRYGRIVLGNRRPAERLPAPNRDVGLAWSCDLSGTILIFD